MSTARVFSPLKDIPFCASTYSLSKAQLLSIPSQQVSSPSSPALSLRFQLWRQRRAVHKIVYAQLPDSPARHLLPLLRYPNQHALSHLLLAHSQSLSPEVL